MAGSKNNSKLEDVVFIVVASAVAYFTVVSALMPEKTWQYVWLVPLLATIGVLVFSSLFDKIKPLPPKKMRIVAYLVYSSSTLFVLVACGALGLFGQDNCPALPLVLLTIMLSPYLFGRY